MRNIRACLEAGGSSLEKVVRRRIYIIDIKQFREVDAIWAEWVGPP
jgi:2-iminobutanoate/2-iminopropanoate deaminase